MLDNNLLRLALSKADFVNGYYKVDDEGDFIDKSGKRVFNRSFEDSYDFNQFGFVVLIDDGKYFLGNALGKILLSDMDSIEVFEGKVVEDTYFIVFKDGYYGVYDYAMNNVVRIRYDIVEKAGNCYIVWINGKCGLIRKDGKILLETKYNSIKYLNDNMYSFSKEVFCGILSSKTLSATKLKYSLVGTFECGIALFSSCFSEEERLFGYINENFEEIIPQKYKFATNFENGLAGVSDDLKNYYFIDAKGNDVFKRKFKKIECFKPVTKYIVEIAEETFYFSNKPSVDCNLNYAEKTLFLTEVQTLNNQKITINMKGKKIHDKYFASDIMLLKKGYFLLRKADKYSIVNACGKIVIDNKYCIHKWGKNYLLASDDALRNYGIIDYDGNVIIPLKYPSIASLIDAIIEESLK